MTLIKRIPVLVLALSMILVAVVPAFAADGSRTGRQVGGTFRVDLQGPLPKGQTFYVHQRGMDTDPMASICTTTKTMGPMAQVCVRGDNDLPFVAPRGATIRYNIYSYDRQTGQKKILARGTEVMRRGSLIEASYSTR